MFSTISALRQYLPQVAVDGQQLVTISGATGGTFTLTYDGVASSALAWNASATTVQTALRAITAIGASGVAVRGRPGGPYTATFQGTLAQDAGPLTANAASLTPTSTIVIAPQSDAVLTSCLARASDIVRSAIRAAIGDPAFDYAAWGAASTRIVRGVADVYTRIPAHQLGSVTIVAYQSGSSPIAYAPFDVSEWSEDTLGRLYRTSGWASYGSGVFSGGGNLWGDWGGSFGRTGPLYQITAIYGYGPDVPPSIEELTLELAVNIYRSRDTGGFSEQIGVEGPGAIRIVAGLNKLQQQVISDLAQQLREIAL